MTNRCHFFGKHTYIIRKVKKIKKCIFGIDFPKKKCYSICAFDEKQQKNSKKFKKLLTYFKCSDILNEYF